MPVVFRDSGFRFLFYSEEGDPREPIHIHVIGGGREAKFWVEPEVRFARSRGFNASELRQLKRIVEERADEIRKVWHGHFSD